MENGKLVEEIVTHAKEWKITIIPGNPDSLMTP
jgi:hypothetical protein